MSDVLLEIALAGLACAALELGAAAWARSLRDQCAIAGVPFFYKQDATATGRKVSLPMLDGRQWADAGVSTRVMP